MNSELTVEQDEKTIGDFVEILKRRKVSLFVPAAVVFVVAVIVALAWPPAYRSTSTILIEEQEIPKEFVMASVTGYAEQRLQTINQRIMSTTRLLEVINRFNLYPEMKDRYTGRRDRGDHAEGHQVQDDQRGRGRPKNGTSHVGHDCLHSLVRRPAPRDGPAGRQRPRLALPGGEPQGPRGSRPAARRNFWRKRPRTLQENLEEDRSEDIGIQGEESQRAARAHAD